MKVLEISLKNSLTPLLCAKACFGCCKSILLPAETCYFAAVNLRKRQMTSVTYYRKENNYGKRERNTDEDSSVQPDYP